MDYQGALSYLSRFVNFETDSATGHGEPAWDLDGYRAYLAGLGSPHRASPSIIVAGTKGKGSVSTLVAAALAAEGRRVGLYTSPHLSTPRERIRVNGEPIGEADFALAVQAAAGGLEERGEARHGYRTWFEIVTAAAHLHFRRERVDVAVLEVGMGGRLDATNAADPVLSVITSISLDHTRTLGSTLGAIAREKAGILRPSGAAVCAPQHPEAREVIVSEARRLRATLSEGGRDFTWAPRGVDGAGGVFDYRGVREFAKVRIGLAGLYQIENAAVALRALEALGERGLGAGDDAIRRAFARARWSGRFEAFPGRPPVLLDGAHNPYSIDALLRSIAAVYPGRPLVALTAISRDKDQHGMLSSLLPSVVHAVATEVPGTRTSPARELAALAESVVPGRAVPAVADPGEALSLAESLVPPGGLLLVTGSLYLVGRAREILLGRERPAGRAAPVHEGLPHLVGPEEAVLDSERTLDRREPTARPGR